MTALYMLSQEYRQAAIALADLDIDEQTLADTLEGMTGEIEVKAENVVMVARNAEALAASIKEAEASMAARRKALENRSARLRNYVLECLQSAGIKKIETPHLAISIRANPPAVDIFDAEQIPTIFMRQPAPPPPAPDKSAIKAELQAGNDVPGARLTSSQRLEIR